MVDESILEVLQKNFPRIAEKSLQEEIAENGKLFKYREGETLMDFGSYVKIIPLVVKGTIKVLREDDEGNEIFLYFIKKGTTCAVSFTCCMMRKRSEIKTVAEEDIEIIGIPIRFMDLWMTKYQSWKNFVMLAYEDRFNELVQTIDNIAFKKMDARLMDYLHKRSEAMGTTTIAATHQQIAYDLNASREAVSRLLKQLEKQGKVALSRNKVELF